MSTGGGGRLVRGTLDFDGGRRVSAWLPSRTPTAVLFAADGGAVAEWGDLLESDQLPPTAIVGPDALADEMARLAEYTPVFDAERFAAHEQFFIDDVARWAREACGLDLPRERTAIYGASAGGELALALGLRHPDLYGTILSASPGAGFQPGHEPLPPRLPRAYLAGGTQEPFFLANAQRWATALTDAGADVRFEQRDADHGPAQWRSELPSMVGWAFR